MIAKFKDVNVYRDGTDMEVHIDVEFSRQPECLIDPSIVLFFKEDKFVSSKLLDRGYPTIDYKLDGIEVYQALYYMSKLPSDKIYELLLGRVACG